MVNLPNLLKRTSYSHLMWQQNGYALIAVMYMTVFRLQRLVPSAHMTKAILYVWNYVLLNNSINHNSKVFVYINGGSAKYLVLPLTLIT